MWGLDNASYSLTLRISSCVIQIMLIHLISGKVTWFDSGQFEFGRVGQCSNKHQKEAFDVHTNHQCSVRDQVVELEIPLDGGVIQVIPSHVTVARCSGSCMNNPGHSCTPRDYRMRKVEVMMVTSTYSQGPLQTLCTTQKVREDISCSCGCSISETDCSRELHTYDSKSCQCVCRNIDQRNTCSNQGKVWDLKTCSCICSPESWSVCSTGYLFDAQNSCSCVPAHYQASTPFIVLIGVLFVVGIGLFSTLMYRKNIDGRRIGRRESLARVLEEDSD